MQQTGTYQTRTADYAGLDRSAGDAVLAAYGELYGRVQRKLFAEVGAGRSTTSLKSWVKPSATGSSGTERAGGCSLPPT